MKKRMLAMLLLVAMIVTALPLMVLPTLAAEDEAKTYTEADYNALYADGVVLGFDTMVLNEYWGEAINARAEFPVSPMDTEAFDTFDERYDYTTPYYIVKRTAKSNGAVSYPNSTKALADGGENCTKANNYHQYKTLEEATAAAAELNAAKTGATYTYEAIGPVRATLIYANRTDDGKYHSFGDALASVANSVPYETKEAAIEAVKTKTGSAEPNEDGAYYMESNGLYYFVVGMDQSDAYKAAGEAYYKAVNAWLAKYNWTYTKSGDATIQSGTNASSHANPANRRRDSMMVHAAVEMPVAGQGYLTRVLSFCTDQGLQIGNGVTKIATAPSGGTMELVSRLGERTGNSFIIFHNLRPSFSNSGKGNDLSGISAFTAAGTVTKGTANRDIVSTFRLTVNNTATTNSDTLLLTQDNTVLYSATGEYKGDDNTYILGYSNSLSKSDFYAVRIYDHALSDAEAAQNHFADIAKWFKVDLELLEMLASTDLPALYAAFADFTFESDKAAVDAKLVEAVAALVAQKYAGTLAEQYAAIATKHKLDLTPLVTNPIGMLKNTLAFLNAVTDESENVKAGYEAALALDTASTLTAEQYNALYATDGMVLGFDFYETNEYWNNAQDSATGDAAAIKTWLNTYVYDGSEIGLGAISLSGGNTAVAKDGYLSLAIFSQLSPEKFSQGYGWGVTPLSYESVRTYTQTSVVSNIFGMRLEAYTSGAFGSLRNGSASIYGDTAAVNASNALGAMVLADTTKVATYSTVARRDALTHVSAETSDTTYTYQVYSKTGSRMGYGIHANIYCLPTEADGETVLDLRNIAYDVTNTDINNSSTEIRLTADGAIGKYGYLNLRDYPAKCIVPTHVIDAEGVKVENTAKTKYWVADPDARFVKGETHLWQNGVKKYENTDLDYINTKYYNSNDDYIVLWGQSGSSSASNPGKLYAGRYYNRALTEAEMAQNHFADIAKFFRLNVAGLETLNAEGKAAVYAAVAGMTFDNTTKGEAQAAVNAVLNAAAKDTYDALKAANPSVPAAFFDLACDYRLDLSTVLSSNRDMSSVYLTTFTGLSCAEAQARLDDAYLDAYQYLSYQREGEDEYNDMLSFFAAYSNGSARVELEDLMALPMADRIAFVEGFGEDVANAESLAEVQGIVDAFVAVKMAEYNRTAAEYDYDALYAAQEDALISMDFFKTNEYWNESIDMPLACNETDGYVYNGVTYNFKSNPADRFFAANEKWAVKRSDGNYVYYKKDGSIACAKNNYPQAIADATIPGQVVMPLQGFATREEAEEIMAKAAAYWTSFTYEIVELPLFIVYREQISNGALAAYGETRNGEALNPTWGGARTTVAYMTMELAAEKAAALAGATYAEGTTSYTSADGKFRYYATLRPVTNEAYYWCCQDYITAALGVFKDLRMDSNTSVNLNMLLPAIGELSYHAPDGGDMYGPFAMENGYAEIDPHHSGAYMNVNNIPTTGDVYFDAIMAGGEQNATDSIAFAFRDAYYRFTTDAGGIYLSRIDSYTDGGLPTVTATTHRVAKGESFRLTIESNVTGNSATYLTKVDGVTVIDGTPVTGKCFKHGLLAYTAKADTRFYSYRIYDRMLTDAEKAQNAFADLAKWYKLDIGLYLTLSEADKAKVFADMADYRIDDLSKAEVQNALNAAVAAYAYAGITVYADAEKNADFMWLAALASLDLSAIKMLDPAAREAFADAVLMNDFDPDYAANADVIYTLYNNATFSLAAMTFAGYQVRLDSGASLANYAGVRAVFDVDEARIAAIIEKNGGAAVTLTVSITGEETATVTIVYEVVEGVLTATGADIYDRAGGKSMNVLVAYKGDEITKANLALEYSFAYTIQIGDAAATAFSVDSATFGDSVSAAEVYGYFYANGYAEDRVVADVMDKCPEAALAADLAGGGVVVLEDDMVLNTTLTIPAGVEVVLDLNGKTITGAVGRDADNNRIHVIVNKGNAVIKNGTVTSAGVNGGSAIYNAEGAVLVVEDVTLNGAPIADGAWPSYGVNNYGDLTVNSAVINTYHGGIATGGDAVTVINNAKIDVGQSTTTKQTSWALYVTENGELIVNDGEFKNTKDEQNKVYGGGYICATSSKETVINGGIFDKTEGDNNGSGFYYKNTNLVIKGGTFDKDPAAYVADGYEAVANGNGTYTVAAKAIEG